MSVQRVPPVPLRPVPEFRATDPRRALHHLHWYLQPLRRWTPIILLLAIAAGVGTYLYQDKVVKPIYQATATVEVDAPPSSGVSGGTSVSDSQLYAPTAAAIIHSKAVANLTLALLRGYVANPAYHKTLYIYMGRQAAPPRVGAVIMATKPGRLPAICSISPAANSQNVTISCPNQQPYLAALLSNAVALSGVSYEAQLQNRRFASMLTGILKQISADQFKLSVLRRQKLGKGARAQSLIGSLASLNTSYTTLSATASVSTIKFLTSIPASVPTSQIDPHPLRSGLLAGFITALLLIGLLVFREYFATALRTPEEITEAVGGAPVLGAILRLSTADRSGGTILGSDPRGATAEGLRVIRTNLLFSNVDRAPRIILITSARQGEGKTTISSNLAVSFAELGGRVLLVDGDLRRPSLHRVFGLEGRAGLTNALLAGSVEPLESFVRRVEPHGLFVMASGPIPPNPAELLSSGRTRELLQRLASDYDTIIIDSPPLLAVADPAILATMVDIVIIVADVNQVTLQTAHRTRDALEGVGSRISGIILNKLAENRRGGYYYNYYYRQSYSYGYGQAEGGSKRRGADQPGPSPPSPSAP